MQGSSKASPVTLDRSYTRRKGAAKELGTQFEYKMAALLYLRAARTRLRFWLGVNADDAGDFDDIVLSYEHGGVEHRLLVQLKHRGCESARVTRQALAAEKGHFSLRKYYDSVRDQLQDQHTRFVLFTNAALDLAPSQDPDLESLLATGGNRGRVSKVDIGDDICSSFRAEPGAAQFINKFIIFTRQASVGLLDEVIKQEIAKFSFTLVPQTDLIHRTLLQEIRKWWELDGNTPYLTQSWEVWDGLEKIEEQSVLFSQIKYQDEYITELAQQIYATSSPVVHIMYKGTNTQLRHQKLLQALALYEKIRYLVSTAERNDGDSVVLGMWDSGWADVLVVDIATGTGSDDLQALRDQLRDILSKHRGKKKLVLISSGSCVLDTSWKQQITDNWHEVVDTCTFQQMDEKSRHRVLDCPVTFQGYELAFSSVCQHHMLDKDRIGEILSMFLTYDITQRLGTSLTRSNVSYIQRSLNRQISIINDIFSLVTETPDVFYFTGSNVANVKACLGTKKKVRTFIDRECIDRYVVSEGLGEETLTLEFRTLCSEHPDTPVHWLEKAGELYYWRQSHGDTSNLWRLVEARERGAADIRRCSDRWNTCAVSDEDLLRAGYRTVLVTGDPGMGKSVLFTHAARRLKELRPSRWVITVDLNGTSSYLHEMKTCGVKADAVFRMLAAAAHIQSSTYPQLAAALLKDAIERTGNVCVLCDAFDETTPLYTETVLSILKILQQSKVSSLWVASRRVMEERLENELGSKAFVLQPFTQNQQIHYLADSWGRDSAETFFTVAREKFQDIYVNSIPLHTMMIAETYKNLVVSGKLDEVLNDLNMHDIYEEFVRRKFDIYSNEKKKDDMTNVAVNTETQQLRKKSMKRHMMCALVVLQIAEDLDKGSVTHIREKANKFIHKIQNGEEKSGILVGVVNGKPLFIHHTFVEYFAALWLSKYMNKYTTYIRQILFEQRFNILKEMFDRVVAKGHPLHLAVLSNDVQGLFNALSRVSASVDGTDAGGRTALHLAAQSGGPCAAAMVEGLLNWGADIEARDSLLECSPLYYAVKVEHWDMVKLLLQRGARVEKNIAEEESVKDLIVQLFTQCGTKHVEYIPRTLEVNWKLFHDERTILHALLECERTKCTLDLDVTVEKYTGSRSYTENKFVHQVVEFILENGSDITSTDKCARTPLHIAVKHPDPDLIKLLLNHGAPLTAVDKYGDTPLHIAAYHHNSETVTLLLDHGAPLTAVNKYLYTPLHNAVRCQNSEIVRLLLNSGALTDVVDEDGDTPLHIAVKQQNCEIAELLLHHGALPTAVDEDGDAPLHVAVEQQNSEMVELLLYHGADVTTSNKEGNTPLHLAVEEGIPEIILSIISHSEACVVSMQNHAGFTPFDIALFVGDETIIQYLIISQDVLF